MANTKARNYSTPTLKRLYALSGNQCAFSNCNVKFLNWDNETNFSNICHIEDANPDTHKSDRYNPNMTDKQRAHYDNLLLLCPNHHITTNDTTMYTVKVLREIKRKHETLIIQLLSGQNLISKTPAVLNTVISRLGSTLFSDSDTDVPITAPAPEKKILHNNVIRYKPIIEEYKIYQGKLNKIYEEIEKQGSTRKEFVLKNIKTIYLKEKGKYSTFEEVKINADSIIECVEKELWKIVEASGNFEENLPIEAIQISILIVLVDAFMRCDILEEPPQHDN